MKLKIELILFYDRIREVLRKLLRRGEPPYKPTFSLTDVLPPPELPRIEIAERMPKTDEAKALAKEARKRRRANVEREKTIDWLIDMMTHAIQDTTGTTNDLDKFGLAHFDFAEPLIAYSKIYNSDDHEGGLIYSMYTPTELPSWDQSLIVKTIDDDEKEIDGSCSLQRARRVNIRNLRGMPIASGVACEVAYAIINPEKKYKAGRAYYTWTGHRYVNPKVWVPHHHQPNDTAPTPVWMRADFMNSPSDLIDEANFSIQLAMGYYDYLRNRWRVGLGWPNAPRVAFQTDPVGVREMFRLRDIPEGKSRRVALRHWVAEHWRKSAGDAEETRKAEIHVRAHLRGELSFTWNGLRGQIVPSQPDRAKNLEEIVPPALRDVDLPTPTARREPFSIPDEFLGSRKRRPIYL